VQVQISSAELGTELAQCPSNRASSMHGSLMRAGRRRLHSTTVEATKKPPHCECGGTKKACHNTRCSLPRTPKWLAKESRHYLLQCIIGVANAKVACSSARPGHSRFKLMFELSYLSFACSSTARKHRKHHSRTTSYADQVASLAAHRPNTNVERLAGGM
jgi:hypothetical protein